MNAYVPDRAALRTLEICTATARLSAALSLLIDRLPADLGDVDRATARTAPPSEHADACADEIEMVAVELEILARRLPARH
ncbi:MAG: hypothetical protein DI561_04635 [Thauera sp.]|nr:MAG: hypothetical protein DI561_04635 [Thauera sp.]